MQTQACMLSWGRLCVLWIRKLLSTNPWALECHFWGYAPSSLLGGGGACWLGVVPEQKLSPSSCMWHILGCSPTSSSLVDGCCGCMQRLNQPSGSHISGCGVELEGIRAERSSVVKKSSGACDANEACDTQGLKAFVGLPDASAVWNQCQIKWNEWRDPLELYAKVQRQLWDRFRKPTWVSYCWQNKNKVHCNRHKGPIEEQIQTKSKQPCCPLKEQTSCANVYLLFYVKWVYRFITEIYVICSFSESESELLNLPKNSAGKEENISIRHKTAN